MLVFWQPVEQSIAETNFVGGKKSMINICDVRGGRMLLFLLILCDEHKADLRKVFT